MADETPRATAPAAAPPPRRSVRPLPAPVRHATVAIAGVLLAVLVSYVLRKLGY